MEERQLHPVEPTGVRDALLRQEELPVGRQVAAVLVGVGVAHHHGLALAARLDVAAVLRRAEERPQHPGGPAQVADGLEEGHEVDVRVEAPVLLADQAGVARERQRREEVLGLVGEAHDDRPGRARSVLVDGAAQLPERLEHLGGRGRERLGRPGGEPVGGLAHAARVLAHVEARRVEAEGLDLAQQAGQAAARDALAAVLAQRRIDDAQVRHHLVGIRVGGLALGVETLPDVGELAPVGLGRVAGEDLLRGDGHHRLVGRDRGEQRLADADHAHRDRQLRAQLGDAVAQVADRRVAMAVEGRGDEVRGAVGVAVLVAPGPRPEGEDGGRRADPGVVLGHEPLEAPPAPRRWRPRGCARRRTAPAGPRRSRAGAPSAWRRSARGR